MIPCIRAADERIWQPLAWVLRFTKGTFRRPVHFTLERIAQAGYDEGEWRDWIRGLDEPLAGARA